MRQRFPVWRSYQTAETATAAHYYLGAMHCKKRRLEELTRIGTCLKSRPDYVECTRATGPVLLDAERLRASRKADSRRWSSTRALPANFYLLSSTRAPGMQGRKHRLSISRNSRSSWQRDAGIPAHCEYGRSKIHEDASRHVSLCCLPFLPCAFFGLLLLVAAAAQTHGHLGADRSAKRSIAGDYRGPRSWRKSICGLPKDVAVRLILARGELAQGKFSKR